MTHFRLRLTAEQLNTVLAALGRQPFDDVAALIQQIHEQAGAQVQAAEARAARGAPEAAR